MRSKKIVRTLLLGVATFGFVSIVEESVGGRVFMRANRAGARPVAGGGVAPLAPPAAAGRIRRGGPAPGAAVALPAPVVVAAPAPAPLPIAPAAPVVVAGPVGNPAWDRLHLGDRLQVAEARAVIAHHHAREYLATLSFVADHSRSAAPTAPLSSPSLNDAENHGALSLVRNSFSSHNVDSFVLDLGALASDTGGDNAVVDNLHLVCDPGQSLRLTNWIAADAARLAAIQAAGNAVKLAETAHAGTGVAALENDATMLALVDETGAADVRVQASRWLDVLGNPANEADWDAAALVHVNGLAAAHQAAAQAAIANVRAAFPGGWADLVAGAAQGRLVYDNIKNSLVSFCTSSNDPGTEAAEDWSEAAASGLIVFSTLAVPASFPNAAMAADLGAYLSTVVGAGAPGLHANFDVQPFIQSDHVGKFSLLTLLLELDGAASHDNFAGILLRQLEPIIAHRHTGLAADITHARVAAASMYRELMSVKHDIGQMISDVHHAVLDYILNNGQQPAADLDAMNVAELTDFRDSFRLLLQGHGFDDAGQTSFDHQLLEGYEAVKSAAADAAGDRAGTGAGFLHGVALNDAPARWARKLRSLLNNPGAHGFGDIRNAGGAHHIGVSRALAARTAQLQGAWTAAHPGLAPGQLDNGIPVAGPQPVGLSDHVLPLIYLFGLLDAKVAANQGLSFGDFELAKQTIHALS